MSSVSFYMHGSIRFYVLSRFVLVRCHDHVKLAFNWIELNACAFVAFRDKAVDGKRCRLAEKFFLLSIVCLVAMVFFRIPSVQPL